MAIKTLIDKLEAEVKAQGLIVISEAAKLKGVSRSAISQLIQRDRLRTETILGKLYVYKEDIENWENQKPGPSVGTVFKLK